MKKNKNGLYLDNDKSPELTALENAEQNIYVSQNSKSSVIKSYDQDETINDTTDEKQLNNYEYNANSTINQETTKQGQNNESKVKVVSELKNTKNGWITFGYLLAVFAFILTLYNLFATLSFLVIALYYLILFIIMIATLFLILLNDDFKAWLNGGQTMSDVAIAMQSALPYTCSIAVALSVMSLIILGSQKGYKGKKKTKGKVFSIIAIVVAVITVVLFYGFN